MRRLHNLVHYVIFRTNYEKIGKVKINKILWFADREYMYQKHDSISHSEYIKQPNGPVPKKINAILKTLEKEGKIIRRDVAKGSYIQHSFISLIEPELDCFTPKQISIIDSWCEKISNMSAAEISEYSHDDDYEIAKNGEVIPIETVFRSDMCTSISDDEIAEAKAIFAS